ncbi:MAG: recombinase RecT [Oscillospiraceae bacterium]|nr:recombinase RecT [Oscillospiraceae bacterium]
MSTTTNTSGIIAAATQTKPAQNKPLSPANIMRGILDSDATKKLLQESLKENAGAFSASILDLYNSDTYLQRCDPKQVFGECLKAVSLKLPINKQLGFAYVIPYGNTAQFQLGYKGMIQLCMRTGSYKYINAGVVYEGEYKGENKLTGEIDISGEKISDTVVGYFAYIETLNGFKKALYWSREKVNAHAQKFSKSFKSSSSVLKTDFDAMAIKTVLRNLLSHYGYMSVEMADAFTAEENTAVADNIISGENDTVIETTPEAVSDTVPTSDEDYPFADE